MNLLQDLGFALRSLRSHIGTGLFATATLAIGLAAAIAISCVVDAVLLRALPYASPDELVQIREVASDGHTMALAQPNYDDLVSAVDEFSSSAYYGAYPGIVRAGNMTVSASLALTGGDFFAVFGVAPRSGRAYGRSEREHVAVVSDSLWQGLLGGRSDAVGSRIQVEGDSYTIVGVMPSGFAFPAATAVWIPYLDAAYTSRTAHNWNAVARLRNPAELGRARLAADALAERLKARFGDGTDAVAFDLTRLRDAIDASARAPLLLLAAGTLFLLLIAIINTTNLLLALNGARARELAVRSALGASGLRVARQILLECLIIAITATALALGGAWATVRVVASLAGNLLPRADGVHLGTDIIGASFAAAGLIALIVTAAVLWNASRTKPVTQLRESGRGTSHGRSHVRTRALLLIGQTALTTALLVGVGLMSRSFLALLAIDPGFDASGAVSIGVSQPWTREVSLASATARRYQVLMGDLAHIPGVTSVGGVSALPLSGAGADGAFWDGSVSDVQHAPPPIGHAEFRVASDSYFRAAGIPLLRGHIFSAGDRADGEHVAIVSAAAARAAFGERDPIGHRIQMGNMDGDLHPLTIIGVVGDVHEERLERAPMGTVYVDLAQRPIDAADFSIVVRSTRPVDALTGDIAHVLSHDAIGIPYRVHPLSDLRADALSGRRLSLLLLSAFAVVAFTLAVGGVYGLMAFSVGQRRHEFAVRQALGSTRGRIVRLVLRDGLAISLVGVGIGLITALAGARLARALLFGVASSDLLTLGGVSLLLIATLVAASVLPARRAGAIAPREALG